MKPSVLFLSAFLFGGCAASSTRPLEPWRLEIATSGGIAGRGAGTYALASDGQVTATLTDGRRCTFALTATELRGFADLLRNARPASWKASYVPENPCCDRFEYVLTLDEGGTITKTKWIDDPLPLPPDLEALSGAVIGGEKSLRALGAERCP
ncbi:MAG: hypothetical protein ABI779_09030 [Acidobacteriota bacterium]